MPRLAILQMQSGVDPEANLSAIQEAAFASADRDASVLFTPEMSLLLDRNRKRAAPWIESDQPDIFAKRLEDIARDCGIDIALGSMPVGADGAKWANRSCYFRGKGAAPSQPITYDKIHMFDVELSTGETWRESNAYEPGRSIVTVEDTALGRLGLSVCYDLRFPALFGALGDRACDVIAVPAAFTKPTGAAHWHVLLRARAIEASAFVVAAAQVGKHEDGRETYGHSLVVDPWGEVLLDMGGEEPGLSFCDIDLGRIQEVRSQIPSLANRREMPQLEQTMIVFDLHCANGHRFEGWFGSSSDYEEQIARGLVACPHCGSLEIGKAPMAPAVPAKSNTAVERVDHNVAPAEATPVSNKPMPAQVQKALSALAKAQQKALENSTWVGKDFAKQSREMHYGERTETAIHGQASLEEAQALADEGVPVAPLPFPHCSARRTQLIG